MFQAGSYFKSTAHPWPCLLFLLPLLIAYEGGILWLADAGTLVYRNGADAWLRWGVEEFGFKQAMAAPIGLVGLLGLWCFVRWGDRPGGVLGLCFGMLLESIILAFALWSISQNFGKIVEALGIQLTINDGLPREKISQILLFIGAGIYEETIFRLLLLGGIYRLMRIVLFPSLIAMPFAVIVSSLLFAAAHHIGQNGEKLDAYVFLFRVTAGLFFGLIYWFRGFGIAVGTHAAYDVLVGMGLPNT